MALPPDRWTRCPPSRGLPQRLPSQMKLTIKFPTSFYYSRPSQNTFRHILNQNLRRSTLSPFGLKNTRAVIKVSFHCHKSIIQHPKCAIGAQHFCIYVLYYCFYCAFRDILTPAKNFFSATCAHHWPKPRPNPRPKWPPWVSRCPWRAVASQQKHALIAGFKSKIRRLSTPYRPACAGCVGPRSLPSPKG